MARRELTNAERRQLERLLETGDVRDLQTCLYMASHALAAAQTETEGEPPQLIEVNAPDWCMLIGYGPMLGKLVSVAHVGLRDALADGGATITKHEGEPTELGVRRGS